MKNKELERLQEAKNGQASWRKWGTYLSERQWATVREDYSPNGTAWDYFPHDHARSRAYRWGEDGIAGWSDDQQQLCFAPTFWNGKDPILKERLFGLASAEGNHGEDVKELYYYLDNTPTHSFARYLYKYPQQAYPYENLIQGNQQRSKEEQEFELLDTGIMDNKNYFNVTIEYAKADAETTCISIQVENLGDTNETIYVLPTLWFRNGWDFGISEKPNISLQHTTHDQPVLKAEKANFGTYYLYFDQPEKILFTENETNKERLYGVQNPSPRVKDSFHNAVSQNDFSTVEAVRNGTKCAPFYAVTLKGGESQTIKLVLTNQWLEENPLTEIFDKTFAARQQETDQFYTELMDKKTSKEDQLIARQAWSGLLWNKQYYNYEVKRWLDGDPGQPSPPQQRHQGRNHNWQHLAAADIISMPETWEFPWFASWDSAFQAVAMAKIDMDFAKQQLLLFSQKRYQREDGALPAYEWNFGDLNPPLQAWAALMIFDMEQGAQDFSFLQEMFVPLQKTYAWWKENEDINGNDLFSGGFLGLDNISLFDRSQVPQEGQLEQADATAWMAMFALHLVKMSLVLAEQDQKYEAAAIDFFDDFVEITAAMSLFGPEQEGLWDEESGFFYDCLKMPDGSHILLTIKSIIGLMALFPVCFLSGELLQKNEQFKQHLLRVKALLSAENNLCAIEGMNEKGDVLISLIYQDKLETILQSILDTEQFLSPFGIRSLSKAYEAAFCMNLNGMELCIEYEPGESQTGLFGGNSNWRGPVWMPINFLLLHTLTEFSKLYGDDLEVAFPSHTKNTISLGQLSEKLSDSLLSIFKKDTNGNRPVHGGDDFYRQTENEDLILFYEYFHGDTGRGCGANHQTGWSALIALLA